MPVSLQRLRYFIAIASGGSFSAAARDLGVAQPALSYHVAEMEREFGVPLFTRSIRGVKLTDAGKILFRRADQILRQIEDLEHEVRGTASEPNGDVTMAVAVTMARPLVPELFAIMNARFPNVRAKILDVGSIPAMELIRSGRAEVALVPNAADMPECEAEAVYAERLCFISCRAGRRRNVQPIRLADIGDKAIVLPNRIYDLRRRVEEAALIAGHRLNVRYEQDSQEMIRTIVLADLAATITQTSQFNPESERPLLDIRPIEAPEISRTHAIVRVRDRALTTAMSAVSLAVREAIQNLVEKGVFPGRYIARQTAPASQRVMADGAKPARRAAGAR
ncbi:MAG: LysR family transcriptional regulator [Burkholderiaceae bacterium]